MSAPPLDRPAPPSDVQAPDVSDIEISDGAPVDNLLSEKHRRLLTEPLYTSWEGPPERDEGDETGRRPFLAASDVGLFATPRERPLVPDVFVSLDVRAHPDMQKDKRHQTYFFWEFGKPPDIVIEIVSNTKGGELGRKKRGYARMRVLYYVVWDPFGFLGEPALHCFELRGDLYVPLASPWFEAAALGLVLWPGQFEHEPGEWLRWCRRDGSLIATGAERADGAEARAGSAEARADTAEARADTAEARADTAEARADTAEARADTAEARAERAEQRARLLAAKMRELGVEPDDPSQ